VIATVDERPEASVGPATPAVGTARTRPRAMRELVLMLGLWAVYFQARTLTKGDVEAATDHAHQVVDVERALGVFREDALQDLALRSQTVVSLLNHYYVGVHFPLTAAFVVWVLVCHSHWYRTIRTWLVTVTAAGLAIHVAYPLAPPRMLGNEGFVDTLREYGPSIYATDTDQSVANQFAAMPSLHFGWALLVALGFIAIRGTRSSWFALLHPLVTLSAIVATANHYFLDAAVAGALVLGFGALVLRRHPDAFATDVRATLDIDSGVAELAMPRTRLDTPPNRTDSARSRSQRWPASPGATRFTLRRSLTGERKRIDSNRRQREPRPQSHKEIHHASPPTVTRTQAERVVRRTAHATAADRHRGRGLRRARRRQAARPMRRRGDRRRPA
jgi:hypothetical protein